MTGDDLTQQLTMHRAPHDIVARAQRRHQRQRTTARIAIGAAAMVTTAALLAMLSAPLSTSLTPAGGVASQPSEQVLDAPNPAEPTSTARTTIAHVAPHAQAVFVVGSFNDWDPTATALVQTSPGVFRVSLELPVGAHEYQLIVDGVWMTDPLAALTRDDGFGSRNGVLLL